MTARMRRIASDWEQVRKDFAGHKNIIVTPVGPEPPEKYHVTYFVNGIYLLPDGRVETLARHEIEITLHAEYPRYKPLCRILTPIWHPNFRDGQICIGDIWGAGESLTDIIVNIGDMIQYKSWNSFSPLSADAAKWAIENKHLFPVGNVDLNIADYASAIGSVEIDLFDLDAPDAEPEQAPADAATQPTADVSSIPTTFGNDFDITAEELAGIEFVPSAQRMQTMAPGGTVKGGKVNFKTVLIKGLLWALIGAFLGFGISELTDSNLTGDVTAAILSGNSELAEYYRYKEKSDQAYKKVDKYFERYCKQNGLNPESSTAFNKWLANTSAAEDAAIDAYLDYEEKADAALYRAYMEMGESEYELTDRVAAVSRMSTGLWAAVLAVMIGLFLGLGEGIFYGSKEKAIKNAALGAGISLVMGLVSGYLAQWMYAELLGDDPSTFVAALIRGLGWAVMGLGIGLAIGLIKPEKRRILFCSLGGLGGGFLGGFLFNYVTELIPNDVFARAIGIILMGALIGVGVGLLEQFAKQAWLKVIRGEFEGKEYLVFAGTTSIGNTGKNTIVLFKDKLVGPHHCDIVLEGSRYVLIDQGTPMGTVVNGQRTTRQVLKHGDAISIGNSVLIFNTK